MRYLISTYIALSVAAILWMALCLFGGAIEGALRPIIVDAKVETISRDAKTACWSWDALKMRVAKILDIDAIVDRNGDLSFPEVRDRLTGRVWHSAGTKPAGPIHHDVCIDVPNTIEPDMPFILHVHVKYGGLTPLWAVTVDLPDVIVPAMAP